MRVLLLHPADSPRTGPWARERWDLIVDLGRSSPYSQHAWSAQYRCPVLGADSFRKGVADARLLRQIFSQGRGRLIDEEGIDWWELISIVLAPEALDVLAFCRMAREISSSAEIWSTRGGWAAAALAILLGSPLHSFHTGPVASFAAGVGHYAGLVRRFSPAQIKEIFFDKYDPRYEWRSRFAAKPQRCSTPVVLLPSAYGNASRMAVEYARMLPQQSFLMVATRENAKQFTPAANIRVRDLAAYAQPGTSAAEITSLVEGWAKLQSDLCSSQGSSPELQVLSRAGVFDPVPAWIGDGISARNAWQEVLEREPVCGVLCGDDSNRYTRLPVLLAARRKIPTVDFHHGAFDGRYTFKELPCDVYMAKSQMERDYLVRVCGIAEEKIVIAAPASARIVNTAQRGERGQRFLILFSEPYEAAGMRGEEFYRELLPPLVRVARENRRELAIKLHPFESLAQRRSLVREILGADEAALVTLLDGPLTADLLAQAWCGITIESTTVMDCWQNGICCFLCGWVNFSLYEYAQQYVRFGVGEVLHGVEQVAEIPARLAEFYNRPSPTAPQAEKADPVRLQEWLTCGFHESGFKQPSGARSAS
jgi:hypothetical protein